MGSVIFISIAVLVVRKRAFEEKLQVVSDEREASRHASIFELRESTACAESSAHELEAQCKTRSHTVTVRESQGMGSNGDQLPWHDDDQITVADTNHHQSHRVFPMVGVGARPDLPNHPRDAIPVPVFAVEPPISKLENAMRGTQKYFWSKAPVSRNSQFHGLTSAEREKLGGVEYKAVYFLSVIVSLYLIGFLVFGVVGIGTWLQVNHPEIAGDNGLSPFWTGAFFAVSAFVNSGMALLDKNMTALQLRYVTFVLNPPTEDGFANASQCLPASHYGHARSCWEHSFPLLSAVHHLDHEGPYTRSTEMEILANDFIIHFRSSAEGVYESFPSSAYVVSAWDNYCSQYD